MDTGKFNLFEGFLVLPVVIHTWSLGVHFILLFVLFLYVFSRGRNGGMCIHV